MRSLAPARLRAVASSFGWTATDQVLSSVSNVVISVAVARGGGASALGAFQLAFATGIIVVGFLRQLVTEPLLSMPLQHSGHAPRAALGSTVVLTFPLAVGTVLAGILSGTSYFVALGVVLIGVCVQDTARYIAFHRQQATLSVVMDATWVAVSAAFWPLVARSGDPAIATAVWGVGATVGATVGAFCLRITPLGYRMSLRWWKQHVGAFGGYLAAAGAVFTIGSQGVAFAVAGFLGTEALGQLRAALILLGPVLMAQTAMGLVAVPRLAGRTHELSPKGAAALSLFAAGIGVLIVAPLIGFRRVLVTLLFADGVPVSTGFVVPLAIHSVILLTGTFYTTLLRAEQRGREIFLAHIAAYGVSGLGIVVVAASFDIQAVAWMFVVQAVVLLVSVILLWGRGTRDLASTEL